MQTFAPCLYIVSIYLSIYIHCIYLSICESIYDHMKENKLRPPNWCSSGLCHVMFMLCSCYVFSSCDVVFLFFSSSVSLLFLFSASSVDKSPFTFNYFVRQL